MSANIFGTVLLWLIGLAVAIVILVYIMRWLYRRSTKETAFVRTGFLGEKVVVNGGAFVIPVLHEITPVNMNVMRIEVVRRDNGALITRNRMRVDIIAEFFVRVGASHAAVAAAAQTLGRRTLQEDGIRSLLEGKFASSMRMVAAQMTLEEMHEQRRDYANQVRDLASEALAANGLELENVAIVDLDQTSLEYFDPSNAFDAEGLTQLTESIETRRKMRNEIEQRTLVDIRSQNLEAQKKVFEIDRETEYARLEQEREVEFRRAVQRAELTRERALREQEAEEAQLSSRESVEKARLAQQRAITEERIRHEEDTQRREIARRRALDEAELKTREQTEREQINVELQLETARIAREREQRELEIDPAEGARDSGARPADRSLRKDPVGDQGRGREAPHRDRREPAYRGRAHCPGPRARPGAARARAPSRGAADRQAPGVRGGRDRGGGGGRARPHRHRARHRRSAHRQGSRHPHARDRARQARRDRRDEQGHRAGEEGAERSAALAAVRGGARQGHRGRGAGDHRPRAGDRRTAQAHRHDRRAARGRTRGAADHRQGRGRDEGGEKLR